MYLHIMAIIGCEWSTVFGENYWRACFYNCRLLIFLKSFSRKDIGRRLIAKTGHVIKKFVQEIEDAEKNFRALNQNPPVAENLPPISGDN